MEIAKKAPALPLPPTDAFKNHFYFLTFGGTDVLLKSKCRLSWNTLAENKTKVLSQLSSVQKLARVSSKGQVVIPVYLMRKHKISKRVLIKEERGRIILEPAKSLEESFGAGGDIALQAAIEISMDRRKEIESERRKLSL